MKELKSTIVINKPAKDIFAFIIDPANTPKWVDGIVAEQTNEWPVKLGSVYRNQQQDGEWAEYVVAAFEPDTLFVLRKSDGLNVAYRFTPVNEHTTQVEYHWWMDAGELDASLTLHLLEDILAHLKQVV